MKEKFYDQISVVGKRALKTLDGRESSMVLILIGVSVKSVLCNLVHPAAVKKRKLPGLRNAHEISVEKRPAKLIFGGLRERLRFIKAGIQVFDHLTQYAALSGAAPAVHYHQHRQLLFLNGHLRSGQLCPGGL